MSSVQARKDEILAKKARLAELKRQRELRQKEFTSSRQSIGDPSDVCIGISYSRRLEKLVKKLTSSVASSRLPSPWSQSSHRRRRR